MDKAEKDVWRCVLPGELRHCPAACRTPGQCGSEKTGQVVMSRSLPVLVARVKLSRLEDWGEGKGWLGLAESHIQTQPPAELNQSV